MLTTYDLKSEKPIKWLGILFIIRAFGTLHSLIDDLTMYDGTWLNSAVTVCVIICLFLLKPVNGRYRTAAIFRTVLLVCSLVDYLAYRIAFYSSNFELASLIGQIYTVVALVLSALAVWFEYRAHAQTAADSKLSKSWHILLACSLIWSILGSGLGYAAMELYELGRLSTQAVSVLGQVMNIIKWALNLVYLWLLLRTTCLPREESV